MQDGSTHFTLMTRNPVGFFGAPGNYTAIPESIHTLDKLKPVIPLFDSTFTQEIESERMHLQESAPTFILLPPSVPIHLALLPLARIKLSILSLQY